MDLSTAVPLHRPADGGDAVWAMGSLFEMKLRAAESGGELSVMLVTQPPGVATPLHVHTQESEVFYLLEGAITYEAGGSVHALEPGSLMWLPKGVPHRFRIDGPHPARILALTVPGGLDALYTAVGSPAAERRIPDPYAPEAEIARWAEVGPLHGMQVLGPPLPA